eukprot:IDg21560t1
MRYEDRITLHFLVASHTKNNCDGAFGMVKRKLKQRNVVCPSEMMKVIDEIALNNEVICSETIRWVDWKGVVEAKELTSTTDWKQVNLLKKGISDVYIKTYCSNNFNDPSIEARIEPLKNFPLSKTGTERATWSRMSGPILSRG